MRRQTGNASVGFFPRLMQFASFSVIVRMRTMRFAALTTSYKLYKL
jgi:hypothetical protein